jgi:transcription initiation factor TFIIE subunit alpha
MHSTENEDPFVKIASLIGGEEYHKVARALLNTEDATDEEIAGATGMRINIIRKVLYDMFGKALITGIRVKDEKKGWFVYRWRAKRDQADEESSEFYHCGSTNCPRIKFDYAMELFFKCPNCKNPLNMVNNEKVKDALRYKIEQILLDISSKEEISS